MTKTEALPAAELSAADEEQAQADFDAGAAGETSGPKTPTETEGKPRDDGGRFVAPKDKPAEVKPADKPAEEKPEYVQLTKAQLDRFEAAAKRGDDIDGKFSKAFGTIGDVQKIVKALQSQTPRGVSVKIPTDAFAAMEKDFPELAAHTKAVLEATLKGMEGTGSSTAQVDISEFENKVEERVLKLAAEDLADEFPEWVKIVGAVDVRKGEVPDANNPFRKWLATKEQAYQDRVNSANSAGVITRAIRAFQSETKKAPAPPAKPNPQVEARTSRIQESVRPKGDGGQPAASNTEDDEFQAGFKTG